MKTPTLLRKLGDYVLRGPVEATVTTILLTMLPFVGWLGAGMVVGLVTLRKNAQQGLVVVLWSALPSVGIAVWGNILPLLMGVLAGTALVWLFGNVLRVTGSWARVLRVGMLLGMVGVAITHWMYPTLTQWWETYFNHMLQAMSPLQDNATLAELKQASHQMAKSANGVVAVGVLLNGLTLLLMARFWQAALFYSGGLKQELYQLRLGIPDAAVWVVCMLGTMAGFSFFSEITPIVMVCFILAALSLMHCYIATRAYALLWQIASYSVLFAFIVVYPQGLLSLAWAGWIDSIIDVRGKFNGSHIIRKSS